MRLSAFTFDCFCYEPDNATGSDDLQAEAEVASGSVQEVSHTEMQPRFAEVKMVSRFAQARERRSWVIASGCVL